MAMFLMYKEEMEIRINFYINVLIISLFMMSCSSAKEYNKQAVEVYKSHLKTVNFLLQKLDKRVTFSYTEEMKESISFLEELTGIEGETSYFDGQVIPSLENYKDWKKWLSLNHSLLYIENDIVKIRGIPNSVR